MLKILIALFFCSSFLFGQNQLDDLLREIKNLPDTTRIDRLTDFCWKNRNKVPKLALKSGEEAARLARSIPDFKREAEALNKMGVVYRNLAKYDSALNKYNQALFISEKIKDSVQVAFSLNNIGGIYRLEGNYNEALRYILEALGIFERRDHKDGMSFCTINIALIYRRQNSPQKALEYLQYTRKIREEINDLPGKALAINLIAEVNFELGKIDEALNYFLMVEKEYALLDDQKGLAATWIGLARVGLLKKDLKNALNYATRAYTLSKKISYFEGEILSLTRLGEINSELGQIESAKKYFTEAEKIASNKKEIQVKLAVLKAYSQFSEKIGDYKGALLLGQKYYAQRDSILNFESMALISQMDRDFRKIRDDQKYNSLLAEKTLIEKRRNYVIALSLLALVLAGVVYNRYRIIKKFNRELSELNSMKDKLFSIIAHDLKNPLHSLFGLTDFLITSYNSLSDDERISLIAKMDISGKQIYRLLENLLYWSRSQTGSIEFSPKMNDMYLMVEETIEVLSQSAASKKIKVENNVIKDSYVYCDSEMIKTVLRNLISNGIKFTNREGRINIDLIKTEGFWKITVSDNGIGMESDKSKSLFKIDSINTSRGTENEQGTGLGLIICKEFIEKHRGSISIESKTGIGTTISFTLPQN